MLDLEVPELAIDLKLVRALLAHHLVLRRQLLQVHFELAGATLRRVDPSSRVLFTVTHELVQRV